MCKSKFFLTILSVMVVLVVDSCGGSGGGGGGETLTNTGQIGQFVDSYVEGLDYESASYHGTTEAGGTFVYKQGEVNIFSVGEVVLGPAIGAKVITPFDLVPDAIDGTDPRVINICRLLLSLDDDGDPSNGITITPEKAALIQGQNIDFSQSVELFEVSNVVLVGATDAQSHFFEFFAGADYDGDGSLNAYDCNDRNAAIYPEAVEICGDGVDQNCNGDGDEACFYNTPPLANAGGDQEVTTGDLVNLDGSGSSDYDTDTLSYIWKLTVPTGSGAVLANKTTATPSFITDVAGVYTVQLIVSDGIDNSAADTVYIVATDVSSGTDSYTNSMGMTFNLLPAGTFTMGSPDGTSEYPIGSGQYPAAEPGRKGDETPHQVTLTQSFYTMTTEVTQAQWQTVMGTSPSNFSSCGTDCPVENVSWNEVQNFIAALNQQTGETYRLPTEAEWEYAARAGSTTAYANGAMTADPAVSCAYDPNLDVMGWYCGNADSTPHMDAQKQANAWGLYDMHGNVWEWVQDWYAANYSSTEATDPTGAANGSYRVIRGAGWCCQPKDTRSANRDRKLPDSRAHNMGFRLVMSAGL